MKNGRFVGMVAAGVLALSGLAAQTAHAAGVPYPHRAAAYSVDYARAMDQCTPTNSITVVNPGGVNGCLQANSVTDANVTGTIVAHVSIRRGGQGVRLQISGSGFLPPAQRVGVQLTIRTTNTLGAPSGSKTYQDETMICGTTNAGLCGHYFGGTPLGHLSGHMSLASCLTANGLPPTLASGNIEVLDSALINCDDNKVIAKPGVLQ